MLDDTSSASSKHKGLLLDFALQVPSAIQFKDDSHSLQRKGSCCVRWSLSSYK